MALLYCFPCLHCSPSVFRRLGRVQRVCDTTPRRAASNENEGLTGTRGPVLSTSAVAAASPSQFQSPNLIAETGLPPEHAAAIYQLTASLSILLCRLTRPVPTCRSGAVIGLRLSAFLYVLQNDCHAIQALSHHGHQLHNPAAAQSHIAHHLDQTSWSPLMTKANKQATHCNTFGANHLT